MRDTIYREDAIKAVSIGCEELRGVFKRCEENINALPFAEPERKKGKWEDAFRSGLDGTRHWYRKCSECGYERDDDNDEKDTKFCPNCGADNRGGK